MNPPRKYDSVLEAMRAVWGDSDPETKAYWDNWARYIASGFPIIGPIVRASDDWKYINDYMKNVGLTWADVEYPSRISGSGSVGSLLNFVSSNIEDLYKDDMRMARLNYDYNVFKYRRYMY